MELCTIDTVGAYLYQDYPDDAEPLYLKLEPGVAEACGLEPCQIYRVRKYLYGLPDAGRAYYRAYSAHLKSNGYLQTISDPCLFMKEGGGARTYVWIHVDDTFVEGLIEFKKVASELNHSDVLTKRVVGQDFRYKAQGLLGLQPGEMRVPSVACKRKKGVGEGVHFDVGPAIADAGGHRSMTEQGPVSTGIGDRYS
jgi:hypothetical protein